MELMLQGARIRWMSIEASKVKCGVYRVLGGLQCAPNARGNKYTEVIVPKRPTLHVICNGS